MRKKSQTKVFISYILLILLAIVMIYPLIWMISAIFKTNEEILGANSLKLIPENPVFDAIKNGWEGSGQYTFSTFIINTFEIVIPSVLFTALSSTVVAYGFARFNFKGKKLLFTIMLSTLMLPETVLLVPRYMLFKNIGWLNTYKPFIVPALLGCYPFFTFMLVQFFRGIPKELDESAEMDGCNSLVILIKVLLPLCTPSIISVIVFQFVWRWNDFLNVLIYISSVAKYPVALALRMSMDNAAAFNWNQIIAMSMVAILPPTILFFCAQKYFVEGITTSGLKG